MIVLAELLLFVMMFLTFCEALGLLAFLQKLQISMVVLGL
jgi:hypothetical protein